MGNSRERIKEHSIIKNYRTEILSAKYGDFNDFISETQEKDENKKNFMFSEFETWLYKKESEYHRKMKIKIKKEALNQNGEERETKNLQDK